VFGTLSGSPTRRVNKLYEIVDNLSHQGGRMRCGRNRHPLQRRHDHVPASSRGAYTFRRSQIFSAGTYSNAGFTQTFGATVVSQTNPKRRRLRAGEVEATPHLTVNAGVDTTAIPADESTPTPTTSRPASASHGRRPTRDGRSCAAAPACSTTAVPLRALANALLSAGNATDVSNLQQNSISLSPTQAGAPRSPTSRGAAASVTLPNLTTMHRGMQTRIRGRRASKSSGSRRTQHREHRISVHRAA